MTDSCKTICPLFQWGEGIIRMKALPLESFRTRSEVTKADVEKITVASSDKKSECYLRATRYLIDAHKNPRAMPARSSRWRPFLLRDTRNTFVYCLCVCLGFTSYSRIFHSHGDITFTGEGLQILTYTRHSWPVSSEGSLACHTHYDTGHPFIMVISEDL